MKITYTDLGRTSERRRQLERPVCRCKDTIKTDFIEIIREGLDWACLTEDTEP
jgi:hypothetical protein